MMQSIPKMRNRCLILAILLFHVGLVHASTLYVDISNGSDTYTGTSWTQALATLTEASHRSVPGDLIRIAQGDYRELLIMKQNVRVEGGYASGGAVRDWNMYPTWIDGDGERRCAEPAEGASIDGMCFRNGMAINGGAMTVVDLNMTISNCLFQSCIATGGNPNGGGALYFNRSESLIRDCRFIDNRVHTSNEIEAGESCGGAVLLWAASPRFIGCEFEGNRVESDQDAMLLLGGAIWCIASHPYFSGSTFTANQSEIGGAIGWWNKSMPDFENCRFTDNLGSRSGGAIGMIYHESTEPDSYHRMIDCVFEDNRSISGGAIVALRHASYQLINCRFSRNHGYLSGGAIHAESSLLDIRMCTFDSNDVPETIDSSGSAVFSRHANIDLSDSIVVFNRGAPALDQDPPQPNTFRIATSDVYGNPSGDYSHSIIDRTGIAGNISVDPLIVEDATGDYCLSEPDTGDSSQIALGRSPCINAGGIDSALFHAVWRSTRTDQVFDGSLPDIGYHRICDAPFIVSGYPGPEDDFASGSRVGTLSIRDRTSGIDMGSIQVTINGMLQEPVFQALQGGWTISFSLDEEIQDCSILEILVSAESLDEPVETLQSQAIICRAPGCASTPTPSPSPPPNTTAPILSFSPDSVNLAGGDRAYIEYSVYNPNFIPQIVDVYVCLEIGSTYLFFPFWDQTLHGMLTPLSPGEDRQVIVFDFQMPPDVGTAGPFVLYGVMTGPGTMDLVGEIEFCAITLG